MSTIKVDSIKSADGNTDLLTLSNGSVSGVNFGRRNLIINGAMQVAQRGTSATLTTAGYYVLDRWRMTHAGAHISTISPTVSQETDSPAGFKNSLKVAIGTGTSAAADDFIIVDQTIEGNNISHLNSGTSDASDFTVSFWVKSSRTGDYAFVISNSGGPGGSSTYTENIRTYTINSANTWEKKTLTFSGETSGTWGDTNTQGFRCSWTLAAGSDWISSNSVNTWQNERKYATSAHIDFADTTSATWQITGVQLEVGSVATPFEHRSYGEELALCQRYYQVQNRLYGPGRAASSSSSQIMWQLESTMRAAPTVATPTVNLGTIDSITAYVDVVDFNMTSNGSNRLGLTSLTADAEL